MYSFVTCHASEQQRTRLQEILCCSVDDLITKCQITLNLFPDNLHFDLFIYDTIEEVQQAYYSLYNKKFDGQSWMSKSRKQIHLSLPKKNFWNFFSSNEKWIRKFCHEIAHIIVECYFTEKVPYHIHELLAQYCHTKIKL